MTIFLPTFAAVLVVTIAFLLPSLVAILAILLTDRAPSAIQTFILIAGWALTVAVFVATAASLPWQAMGTDGSFGAGFAIFMMSVVTLVTAGFAGHKLATANYRFGQVVSGLHPTKMSRR